MSKRLDEMDDLRDMGRFPLSIYAGATGNILLTIIMTRLVQGRYRRLSALPVWAGGITLLNVLPVFLLRSRLDDGTRYPEIERMSFFTDQHKFAGWVYAVASANMVFWAVLSWLVFSRRQGRRPLLATLLLALVCNSYPAWRRLFAKS